jgi:hypothetical protein
MAAQSRANSVRIDGGVSKSFASGHTPASARPGFNEQIREAYSAMSAARDQLVIEANAKALTFDLTVDKNLSRVVDFAIVYPDDDAVFSTAIGRADKGNPPGKKDSYGDQYNWEMLLAKVPEADLYVVSKDTDFASALAKSDKNGAIAPNDFLRREWAERKGKKNLYVFP